MVTWEWYPQIYSGFGTDQFGWLSERGGSFLNMLQKEGGTQKGGYSLKKGVVPTLEGTIPYWILLKFWAQTRKLKDKQNSKIDSPNGSWYFNKAYVDGRWFIFRHVCFVIFSWLSMVCYINDCPIVLLYILWKDYSGKPDFLILKNKH